MNMFTLGYFLPLYLLCAGQYFWKLSDHPNPALGALASFLFVPFMIFIFTSGLHFQSGVWKNWFSIRLIEARREGLISEREIFLHGFVSGCVALLGASTPIALAAYHSPTSGFLFLTSLILAWIILTAGIHVGVLWIYRKAGRLLEELQNQKARESN